MFGLSPLVLVIIGLAVLLIVGILTAVILSAQSSSRNRAKRRIKQVVEGGDLTDSSTRKPSLFSNLKAGSGGGNKKRDIEARLREADERKAEKPTRTARYRKDLRQAGIKISLQRYFTFCAILAVVASLIYALTPLPVIGIIPIGLTIGFGIPLFVVRRMGARRVNKFTLLFADAVDVIIRGIRSGLPVGECLAIIGRESPAPVNEIFQNIVEATKVGLSLEQALARAEEDMPTPEFRYFIIVLNIQAQTGGNLADTLSNLSSVLRDRKRLKDKIQALSSEAKASAMIIGSLPFLVASALWILNPAYMGILFTTTPGQVMILGCLIWMSIGIFIMRQMINFDF